MTDAQKVILKQLYDTIIERFGTLARFCSINNLKYTVTSRFLNSEIDRWDRGLFDALQDMSKIPSTDINNDIVLLRHVIKKNWGTYEACCKALKIHPLKLNRVMQEKFPADSKDFREVAFIIYSNYLHSTENIPEYIATLTPAKYLLQDARRRQVMNALQKNNR